MKTAPNKYDNNTYTLKGYLKAPIFTVTKTDEERAIKVGDDIWTIGVDNPIRGFLSERPKIFAALFKCFINNEL